MKGRRSDETGKDWRTGGGPRERSCSGELSRVGQECCSLLFPCPHSCAPKLRPSWTPTLDPLTALSRSLVCRGLFPLCLSRVLPTFSLAISLRCFSFAHPDGRIPFSSPNAAGSRSPVSISPLPDTLASAALLACLNPLPLICGGSFTGALQFALRSTAHSRRIN